MLLLSFTKIAVSVLILWLKAKCQLKIVPFIVELSSNINICIFGRRNTSVKFVAKIARLFRGQIDPLIIFWTGHFKFHCGIGAMARPGSNPDE